ncbi:hypothetical protein [Hwangdonia lutea]|uniref:Uncharacterized protein n=1 Tax=Hwangdonia lutea TaxID=3075823 RepID=A0AA97EMQ4_9FLAO|nr:hypothetical protein [Hwangdonia sp. SCSIO 19198]WOD44234.1 hypothetical protein RNZ46_02980 [Hwangdonia sp. SCSIO 19198]
MKTTLLILAFLLSINAASQNLECRDFKNGTFIMTIENPLPSVSKIIRRGHQQTEILIEKPKELEAMDIPNKLHVTINWIDNCTYIATFNSAKTNLKDYQKFINDNGGVLVEKIKIEGRCFFYRSTLKLKEESIVIHGKICKE